MPEPTREEVDGMAGPVVLEFGADWCPHCQAIRPLMAEMRATHPEVRHVPVADGRGKPLGRSFRVKLWPTLVFMTSGRVVLELVRPSAAEVTQGFRELANSAARHERDPARGGSPALGPIPPPAPPSPTSGHDSRT